MTIPRFSVSLMHRSTTNGLTVLWAFTRVIRSTPKTRLTCFKSGKQSLGTFSEHFLWALKPQSVIYWNSIKDKTIRNTYILRKLLKNIPSHFTPWAISPHMKLPQKSHHGSPIKLLVFKKSIKENKIQCRAYNLT